MTRHWLRALGGALLLVAAGRAQPGEEPVHVKLRVTSQRPPSLVVVDRGRSDRIALGDVVFFTPRDGSTVKGTVIQLAARSAVVELDELNVRLDAGTPGEVRIPASRLDLPPDPRAEETDPAPVPHAPAPARSDPPPERRVDEGSEEAARETDEPEHPPWRNRDEAYEPGMPLLAEVRPVPPAKRSTRVTGRVFLSGDANRADDGLSDVLIRSGTDLVWENPFGLGGGVRADVEFVHRDARDPDERDEDDFDLRVNRLSHFLGGTRYRRDRYEVGRFLQHGMPEFGLLDGFEWGRRTEGGDRFGASVGFLPELDFDVETGDDFQVAAYYQWISDSREQLSVAGGFQKTFHDGRSDRSLVVGKVRYLPITGWSFFGTVWVDVYEGNDDEKDSTVELTQAYLTASRRSERSGIDVTYRRIRFPELLRDEFTPILPDELEDNRFDRLSASAFRRLDGGRRLHGQAGVWDDEDDAGGFGEAGIELQDFLLDGARGDVTLFGTAGRFERVLGARFSYGRYTVGGRWDLFYEIADHRQEDFSSDFDDIVQHRLRGSLDVYTRSGFTVSFYGEAGLWDDETSVSGGFYLQQSF